MSISHQPVIDGLTELYQTLVEMQYLPKQLVRLPPHTAADNEDDDETTVNVETGADVGFDEEVMELMQKLPYITGDSDDWYVAPYTHPVSYLKEWRIDGGRDPLDVGRNDLPPHALALTWGASYGTFLIYDTKTGKITDWVPENDKEDEEDEPEGYEHLPSQPAGDVLSLWIKRLKSLEWIPVFINGKASIKALDNENTSVYDTLKKAYTDCGWPKDFKADEFVEKRKQWEATDLKAYIQQMDEDRKHAMEEPDEE